MKMNRRRFLQGVGGGLALGAVGGLPGTARAALAGASLPGCATYNVLEIFLEGALSHTDTFWWEPRPWHRYAPGDAASVKWNAFTNLSSGLPAPYTLAGHPLGPACQPLWGPGGAALRNRMRILAMHHDLAPHEAAQPLALTGNRLGRPRMAGMGAAVERMYGTPGNPAAYILYKGDPTLALTAARTGLHGAAYTPMLVEIRDTNWSYTRSAVAQRGDDLFELYRARYDGLRSDGATRVRSAGHDAYDAAARRLMNIGGIAATLQSAGLFTGVPDLNYHTTNKTRHAIGAAVHLLNSTSSNARYVGVIDGGLGLSYDTHHNHGVNVDGVPHTFVDGDESASCHQTFNLWNVLDTLRGLVASNQLNLDRTLVALTTEFGRCEQGGSAGTDHWPYGYVNVLIGGPVAAGVSGSMSFNNVDGGTCNQGWTPTDVRAALLLAAGIQPFQPDVFAVDEAESVPTLRDDLLDFTPPSTPFPCGPGNPPDPI